MCFFFKLNDGFCIFYVLSDIIFVGSLFFVQCNLEAPTALEATGEHVFGAETWLHPEIQCFFFPSVASCKHWDTRLDFLLLCLLMNLLLRPIHLVLHCAWVGQDGFATERSGKEIVCQGLVWLWLSHLQNVHGQLMA